MIVHRLTILIFLMMAAMSVKADFAISCSDDEYMGDAALHTKETIVIDSGRGQFMLQTSYPQGEEDSRYSNPAKIYWLPIRRAVTKEFEYVYTQNHHFESGISSISVDRRINYIKVKYTSKKPQKIIKDSQWIEALVGERDYRKNCRILDMQERRLGLSIVRTLQEKSRKYEEDGLNQDAPGKTKI